jgi:hypothetical protein
MGQKQQGNDEHTTHNPAHALDAAMSLSLHVGRHWRGASDVRRWA